MARELSKHKEVESVDLLAGDWELIIKVRTKNQDDYYDFLRTLFPEKKVFKRPSP